MKNNINETEEIEAYSKIVISKAVKMQQAIIKVRIPFMTLPDIKPRIKRDVKLIYSDYTYKNK